MPEYVLRCRNLVNKMLINRGNEKGFFLGAQFLLFNLENEVIEQNKILIVLM